MPVQKTSIAIEAAKHGIKAELTIFYQLVGIGFHPDNDFNDYLNLKGYENAFTKDAADSYNERLDECFKMAELYDLNIYALTCEVMPEIE